MYEISQSLYHLCLHTEFMWPHVAGWGPGTVAEHGTTGILNSVLVRMCKQVQKFSYNAAESCLHNYLRTFPK
jgi:hypothetical protein